MATSFIRPKDLPPASSVNDDAAIPVDNGTQVEKATPKQVVDTGRPIATEAQATEGTDNTVAMTPLSTRQALEDYGNPFTADDKSKVDGSLQRSGGAMTGNLILNANPTSSMQAATKKYVDDIMRLEFSSRAEFVAWVALNSSEPGWIASDGTVQYVASSGATAIADLPGWLPLGVITPRHFGAAGDATTDDTSAVQSAVYYAGSISNTTQGLLPGVSPQKNVKVVLDLDGGWYNVTSPIDINVHGLVIRNGTLIAEGTWSAGAAILTQGTSAIVGQEFRDLVIQCNQKSCGIYMFQPILFRIENVKVWGCSSTQYGIRFFNNGGGPANVWSTAGSIVRASSVYGTTNADAEVAAEPLNRTSIGIDNQVSDVTFIGCEAAYHLECFRHRRGGIIMSACHIWNGYPPDHSKAFTNPTGIYVEEDVSLTVDSCYIDNCVIKAESGLKLQVTNNQWFTAAAVACGYCVRLRPQTSNDLLENFVMTGNQVHGTFSKLVEIDTTDGSFLKTNKAVVADNVILDYDTGNKGLANQSKGRVVASVVPGDFIGTDVSIDISSYMLLPSNADTPLITVSYNQGTLGNVVFNGYKWTAGGVVTLRFDQTFTGNVVIDYDQTFVTNFL